MEAFIQSFLAIANEVLPFIEKTTSPSGTVGNIIRGMEELVPVVQQGYSQLLPPVKNIIAALKDNPATTEEQMKSLEDLDAQADADFEKAAADAEKEDEAAGDSSE